MSKLVTRLEGSFASVVEETSESAFDTGLPADKRDRAKYLQAHIREQEFRTGDTILLTINIDGVYASALVRFVSLSGRILHVISKSRNLSIDLKESENLLGFALVNVCLYKAIDAKDDFEENLKFTLARFGGPRTSDDESPDEVDDRMPRPITPLNPVTFILRETADGDAVMNWVAYEKGTLMQFSMVRLVRMATKTDFKKYSISGNLMVINEGGITLENVDRSLWELGEVLDEEKGICRFSWKVGDEKSGHLLLISGDRTTNAGTFEWNMKRVPEEKVEKIKGQIRTFKENVG